MEITGAKPGDGSPEEKLSRVERKRRDSRARIVAATEQLMKARDLDELKIAEITDAADVGHGTFYTHFKSKFEVLVPIVHEHVARWDETIRKSRLDLQDPAKELAYTARHLGRMMAGDQLFRWFLQHSGVPVEDIRKALGSFVARDIRNGLESGRFRVPELEVAMSFLFGGIVSSLLMIFDLEDPDDTIDQLTEMMLRNLGLTVDEARTIAHLPLSEVNMPD